MQQQYQPMYGCKYLNFSRSSGDMDLITRRTMMELEGEKAVGHMGSAAELE